MARYKGPKCKLCRREGEKLYLKGARCHGEKCAINKRPYAPGQHGNARTRTSEYGKQLREKQKAKRIYGILEKQFRKYVDLAFNTKGVTGEELLKHLEARFDNMVYRSGFAVSRAQARQYIRSGFFTINDNVVTIPAYELKPGDVLKPVDFSRIHIREGFALPDWIEANVKEKHIKLIQLPSLENKLENVNVQLIIEYYSR